MNQTAFPALALKWLVAALRSPEGGTAVGIGLGTLVSPAVSALIAKWGTEGLATVLETWTKPEITDAEMAAELATKGFKVVPFDPSSLWGAKA